MDSTSLQLKLAPHNSHELIGWNAKTIGAFLGICGGIIAPIAGSVLTIVSWFTGYVWHGLNLHRDGTILFVLTFPLLVLGAHCLDLIEKQDPSRKALLSIRTIERRDQNSDLGRDKRRS